MDDSHKEHDPEQFLADESTFPEPSAITSIPSSSSSVITLSNQGFFAFLFTKVSQFFHSLISNPKSRDSFKDIVKYQDFVTRHNMPFDELVKLYSTSPDRGLLPAAPFAITIIFLLSLFPCSIFFNFFFKFNRSSCFVLFSILTLFLFKAFSLLSNFSFGSIT